VTRTGGTGGTVVFATPARSATLTKAVGGAVTYTDTTAVPLTSYSYTVAAITSAAGVLPVVTGAASPAVTASIGLSTPAAVTATQTATGITVGWTDTANNDIGFQIVRTGGAASATFAVTSTAAQKTAVAAARTYIDTTALPGVAYTYSVATTGGTTALPVYSAPATASVTAVVAAPSIPTVVITNATRITLSWTDLATNETGFLIERSTDGGANFVVVTTLARTAAAMKNTNVAVSYVDNLLAPVVQGSYQYRVTAVNQTGTLTNASSAPVLSSLLDFTAPAAPTALIATAAATTTVALSWTDNASTETGFSVQRSTNATFATGVSTTAVAGAVTSGTGSYLATGLKKGTTYYFRVAATNTVGASAYATATAIVAP
jgi:titin